jgi:hypothetical protein
MWQYSIVLVAIVFPLSFAGCHQHDNRCSLGCNDSNGDTFLLNAVKNSPTYQALEGRTPFASFMIDETGPDGFVLSIGEDFPDHFARQASLKVLRTGEVLRQADPIGLEEGWVVEFSPAHSAIK